MPENTKTIELFKGRKFEEIYRHLCIGVIDFFILWLIFAKQNDKFCIFNNLKEAFEVSGAYFIIPVLGMTHYAVHRVFLYIFIERICSWLG